MIPPQPLVADKDKHQTLRILRLADASRGQERRQGPAVGQDLVRLEVLELEEAVARHGIERRLKISHRALRFFDLGQAPHAVEPTLEQLRSSPPAAISEVNTPS